MFDDRTFILTDGYGSVYAKVQGTALLAQCGTDAACELGEVIGSGEQFVSQFPLAFIDGILPFGLLVAQRACPMTERNAAVHAA